MKKRFTEEQKAFAWRNEMMGVILSSGPLELLDRVGELRSPLLVRAKRDALESLHHYIRSRVEMLASPQFRARGYDIGSGPSEAFCKALTARLKGPGMRWD